MENSAKETPEKPSQMSAIFKLRVALAGLAHDFWNDGDEYPAFLSFLGPRKPKSTGFSENTPEGKSGSKETPLAKKVNKKWKADKIKVLEKMWGSGRVIPGDEAYWSDLTAPLGLTQEMNVLDLRAGLGGLARYITEEYGPYVTGMEADQLFAARGMILSIAAGKSKQASVTPYDPTTYTAARKYDCVIARELFYSIIGKENFFQAINDSLKNGGGQLVFTDLVLDVVNREKPAVIKWLEIEKHAAPISALEMIKLWKAKGYDVRVSEDQTEEYKLLIVKGLANFVQFISQTKPDHETKQVILAEIEFWARRYMALKEGLKYYRINAIKR